jgi:hypothetical protein
LTFFYVKEKNVPGRSEKKPFEHNPDDCSDVSETYGREQRKENREPIRSVELLLNTIIYYVFSNFETYLIPENAENIIMGFFFDRTPVFLTPPTPKKTQKKAKKTLFRGGPGPPLLYQHLGVGPRIFWPKIPIYFSYREARIKISGRTLV